MNGCKKNRFVVNALPLLCHSLSSNPVLHGCCFLTVPPYTLNKSWPSLDGVVFVETFSPALLPQSDLWVLTFWTPPLPNCTLLLFLPYRIGGMFLWNKHPVMSCQNLAIIGSPVTLHSCPVFVCRSHFYCRIGQMVIGSLLFKVARFVTAAVSEETETIHLGQWVLGLLSFAYFWDF